MNNSDKKLSEITDEPPKKTRGRKKKVQQETEDDHNIDIEQLQIEHERCICCGFCLCECSLFV